MTCEVAVINSRGRTGAPPRCGNHDLRPGGPYRRALGDDRCRLSEATLIIGASTRWRSTFLTSSPSSKKERRCSRMPSSGKASPGSRVACGDGLFARPWKEELAIHPRPMATSGTRSYDLIAEDDARWEQYPLLEQVDPSFPDAVIADYDDALRETEREVFGSEELPADVRHSLRTTPRFFLSRCSGVIQSGLVIAGMGEAEHFPGLVHCSAGPIVKGRLRQRPYQPVQITHGGQATICPFAQVGTIETIIQGIHPYLFDELVILVSESLNKATGGRTDDETLKRFNDRLEQKIEEKYSDPFVTAVAAMPRRELATIAEVLVSLTVFRAHASVGEQESVAGPIDVALLSKGGGFVWVKRKRSGAE